MGPNGGQVLAVTTNGTSSSQSWGILSGTSNCVTMQEQAELIKQKRFLSANLSTLQKEMANGKGETLDAFVEILGCEDTALSTARSVLYKNYSKVFAQPGVEGVLDGAKEQISKSKKLAKKCPKIS